MLCTRCLLRAQRSSAATTAAPISALLHSTIAASSISSSPSQPATTAQPFSTSSAHQSGSNTKTEQAVSASATETSTQQRAVPAATSTAAAQPFSTPLVPSPQALGITGTRDSAKGAPRAASRAPAGMALRGLNYFKGAEDPVALEDHEYPDWLWRTLDAGKGSNEGRKGEGGIGADGAVETDLRIYSKSARVRQAANKRMRKAEAKAALLNPDARRNKVPVYEQSIDLDPARPEERNMLTKAMRSKRRKSIKEDNFLREMR